MNDPDPIQHGFFVERLPHQVWRSLTIPPTPGETVELPGLVSYRGDARGAEVRLIESDGRTSATFEKRDAPFDGSTVSVEVGPANASGWPTHVRVGLVPATAHGEVKSAETFYWHRGLADFRFFLESDLPWFTPVAAQAIALSLELHPAGLRVESSIAPASGLRPGDVLLAVSGARTTCHATFSAVCEALRTHQTSVVSTVVRGGVLVNVELQLDVTL